MTVRGNLAGKLEETIEGLEVNEEGFTLPWALSLEAREDGRCNAYLHVKYPVSKMPEGTFKLYVKRTGHGKENYEVDLESVGDFKYSLGKTSYVGANEEDIVCIGQVDMV